MFAAALWQTFSLQNNQAHKIVGRCGRRIVQLQVKYSMGLTRVGLLIVSLYGKSIGIFTILYDLNSRFYPGMALSYIIMHLRSMSINITKMHTA